jgi:hypothetical protein
LMNYTKKRAEVLRRRRQWRNALTMMKRETILVLTVEKRERGRDGTHTTHERPSVVLSTLKYPTRLREKLMKNSNQLLGHCVK